MSCCVSIAELKALIADDLYLLEGRRNRLAASHHLDQYMEVVGQIKYAKHVVAELNRLAGAAPVNGDGQ